MKKVVANILSVLVSVATATAAPGLWQTYLSFPEVTEITQSPNKIYAIGGGTMFSLDKADRTIETYSTLTGLSDMDIRKIRFSETDNALLIVYDDSNIDLMTPRGIVNLPELRQKDMPGSKRINQISFDGKGAAYLAADFGILKVSMKKQEISDTYYVLPGANNVQDVTFLSDSIYAATDNEIFAALAANKMLANPKNWTKHETIPEPEVKNAQLASFDGSLLLLKSNGNLYRKIPAGAEWTLFKTNVRRLNKSQNRLCVAAEKSAETYTSLSAVARQVDMDFDIYDAVFDASSDAFFAACGWQCLGKIFPSDRSYAFYRVDGPASNQPYTMKFSGDRLYVITVGPWIDGVQSTIGAGTPGWVMIYDRKSWKNIGGFADAMDIAIDPKDQTHFYVGTFSTGGVLEFRNDQLYKRHTATTSGGVIENVFGNENDSFEIIDGLSLDENGDLWMTQTLASNTIKVMRSTGEWEVFRHPYNVSGDMPLRRNVKDGSNSRWVVSPMKNFVFVYNAEKNQSRMLTSFVDQDGKSFSSEYFHAVAVDREDPQQVWIGSNNGPVIVPVAKNIFSSNQIKRIKIPRNDGTGLADYLLENELINYIFVDGANRKWLATRTSGAYLVSPDGTETIEHFTAENSPLLSNDVYSIAVDSYTGEVFFCTGKGICSYMGDASEAQDDYDDIQAFPNPVREDYYGTISIIGLMENSSVKITDISGNLVYETVANGGKATWDGTDRTGRRVPTGVYLAMAYSESKKKSSACKILIINND